MFTGIIECVGSVKNISRTGKSLVLSIESNFENYVLGESIAVNGICLTVTRFDGKVFSVDATPETFNRTSLGLLAPGSLVNLERAMAANGRFGGHIVSGHVDGTCRLVSVINDGNAVNMTFSVEKKHWKYIIEKGSVCIDGISLTVSSIRNIGNDYLFSIAVIPHTYKNTTLGKKRIGSNFNIECDAIAKYVEKLMPCSFKKSNETLESIFSYTSFHN